MTKSFWKPKLLPFLAEDTVLNAKGADVYGLRAKQKITFWFDGGLKVTGSKSSLTVNFKDPDLLVLSSMVRKTIRIYRVPYARLICFELIFEAEDDTSGHANRFDPN